jgi:tetratricopeptide (TPR) repeat protein
VLAVGMAMVGNGALARSRAQELSDRAMAESCVKDTQDLAVKHIDEALAFDSRNASFWLAKAVILEKRGEGEKALPCVIRSIELNNKNDYAYAVEANILSGLHRFDAALKAIDYALKLKPCKENFVGKAEIFTEQGKPDIAEKELDRVIKANPNFELARTRRAVVARRIKHWPKAIEDFTWLIDHAPMKNLSYYEDLLERVKAYTENKQFDKAIADCKIGLAGQPEARQFHAALLTIYERSGNAAEAKRARKELEAVDDDLRPPK